MRTRRLAGLAAAATTALAAWELAAVARVWRQVDAGGRGDHAATVGEGVGAPLRLALLGDSAVDGYGLDVTASLPRQVAGRVAGATGRRVAVVVGVGVNDVLGRTPPTELRDATQSVAAGLRALPGEPAIAVVVTHDLSRAPGLGPVLRRVVARRCRSAARVQRQVLDEAGIAVVAMPGPGDGELYGDDGLHPGAAGIARLAEAVSSALLGGALEPA